MNAPNPPKRREIIAGQLFDLAEPPCGWRNGFAALVLHGRCPWCGNPALNATVDQRLGLRWSCFEGCNP